MDGKRILIAGILGGIVLFIVLFGCSYIANLVAPYDIFALGGMRAMNDPIGVLFFAYPFVISFAGAIVFDMVKDALKPRCCGGAGLQFALILILLVMVPGMFAIYSSMTYPAGFYLGDILFAIIGFPLFGIICARIWEKETK